MNSYNKTFFCGFWQNRYCIFGVAWKQIGNPRYLKCWLNVYIRVFYTRYNFQKYLYPFLQTFNIFDYWCANILFRLFRSGSEIFRTLPLLSNLSASHVLIGGDTIRRDDSESVTLVYRQQLKWKVNLKF